MIKVWRAPPQTKPYNPPFSARQIVKELHADFTSDLLKKLIDGQRFDSRENDESDGISRDHSCTEPFTITVGGVTLGGSGKTQVVRYLAERFLKHGCLKLYILGHGYRSQCKKTRMEPSDVRCEEVNSFEQYGDEAVMLASCFCTELRSVGALRLSSVSSRSLEETGPKVKVLVGGSWYEKWNYAKKQGAQVIISDGGLYTCNLPRHIGVTVLSSYDRLALLPWGRLSRPRSLWAQGTNYILWGIEDKAMPFKAGVGLDIKAQLSQLRFICVKNKKSLSHLPTHQNGKISVVCGIANPIRFRKILLQMGYHIDQWLQVRDHVPFSKRIIQAVNDSPEQIWVTTMKDVPKFIDPPSSLWALDFSISVHTEINSL